jgi:cobalt-zinc-cadmium efflux system membrane fusion protein
MRRLIYLFFSLFLFGCQNLQNNKPEKETVYNSGTNKGGYHQKRHRERHTQAELTSPVIKGETIIVPSDSPIKSKLVTYKVVKQNLDALFTTTGIIKPLPGHKVEIAPPFDGRIVKSFVSLGQRVRNGTPLFEVNSSDYFEYVKLFFQAKNERDLAEKNFLRKQDLLNTGVSSRKEFDEAKFNYELAVREFEKTVALLKIFNINPEEADISRPLIIKSPISGEVVRTEITIGQYVKSDNDPIITIADIDKIWAVANVKEKDLGSISLNDDVEVLIESQPEKPFRGIVKYIGNIMNTESRSVEVYIECPNPDHLLKCGMFVTVRFYHELKDVIIIPEGSLLQDYNSTYVFANEGPDQYVKREVNVSSMPDKRMIVHSGLKDGDMIISEGGIYLR